LAKGAAESTRSVGALISLFLHFPEMSRVHYDHGAQVLRVSFFAEGDRGRESFRAARRELKAALRAFFRLERRRPERWRFVYRSLGNLAAMELTRDVGTLTAEEISVFLEILRLHFVGRLLLEPVEGTAGDGVEGSEPLIEEMLEDLRFSRRPQNLLAWREAGRVLVFNK